MEIEEPEIVCRLCFTRCTNYFSLQLNDGINIVETLTSIRIIKDEKFPTAACANCWRNIKLAYKIREDILEAHKKFLNQTGKAHQIAQLPQDDVPDYTLDDDVIKEEKNQIEEKDFLQAFDEVQKFLEACPLCGLQVEAYDRFSHAKGHFFDEQTCQCGEEFENINEYYLHYESKHREECKTWFCAKCDLSFRYKTLYNAHLKGFHPESCQVEISVQNIDMSENAKPTCEECGAKYKNNQALSRHFKKVHFEKPKPTTCDQCGNQYKSAQALSRHVTRVHLNEKAYLCEHCAKSFHHKHYLKVHVKRVHKLEKNYVCEYCAQRFGGRSNFNSHLLQHTKEMPYKCELCDLAFRQNSLLRLHRKSKHNITEEIKSYCKLCERGFKSDFALDMHMNRLHSHASANK